MDGVQFNTAVTGGGGARGGLSLETLCQSVPTGWGTDHVLV